MDGVGEMPGTIDVVAGGLGNDILRFEGARAC